MSYFLWSRAVVS